MLTKSTARLIVLVLITSFVGLRDLTSAGSRDSNPQPIPSLEMYEGERVKNEFLGRLKDRRSVAHRKESVTNDYASDTKLYEDFQKEYEEVTGEMAALRSQYNGQLMPDRVIHSMFLLDIKSSELSSAMKTTWFRMGLLVEEYDVLSRLEEAEREYKGKALSKADYRSEERRLREELFQLRIARQLDQLEWQLSQSLSRIEKKLPR